MKKSSAISNLESDIGRAKFLLSRFQGKWLALPIISCAILLGFVSCKAKPKEEEAPPVLVEVTKAVQTNVEIYISAIGTMNSTASVKVTPQVGGRLATAHFKEGTEVKKGDLLFSIDPQPFEASLKKAEATLSQNEASLALAKAKLERSGDLRKAGYLAPQDFEQLEEAVKTGEAAVKSSKADVVIAAINLEYCSIRSPVDGLTGIIKIHPGNVVSDSSSDVLVEIQTMDSLFVDFNVPAHELPRIRDAMKRENLKVQIASERGGINPQPGELVFLNNAVSTDTATIQLRAIAANGQRIFWPGQFAEVRLILQAVPDALVIPLVAVQVGNHGEFVMLLNADSTASLVPVKTGQLQGENIVIREGLKPGADVIVNGQLGLKPGIKVKVVTSKTP